MGRRLTLTGVATWRIQTLTRQEKEGTTALAGTSCKLRFTSID